MLESVIIIGNRVTTQCGRIDEFIVLILTHWWLQPFSATDTLLPSKHAHKLTDPY